MALTEWVISSGGLCSKVAITPSAITGRCTRCTEAVAAAGETLIRVPERCLLTLSKAKDSDIGRLLVANGRDFVHRGAFVSAFLLQERAKGPASPWHPYIAALPTSYSFPIQWPADTLALLRGCRALSFIASYRQDIIADHLTLMFATTSWTLEEFTWARLAVSSRAFGADINDVVDELVCVPLIDVINHSVDPAPNTRWGMNPATNAFETQSARAIAVGEEVHESYGDKSNSMLLAYYGFALVDNPHNAAVLELSLAPSDERSRMRKTTLLEAMCDGLAEAVTFEPTTGWGEEAERMLSFLRIAQADDAEVTAMMVEERKEPADGRRRRVKEGGTKRVRAVGQSNEERVWRAVRTEALRRLDAFEESLEEDERLLGDGRYAQGSAEWSCVVTRLGEKKVLRWWQESAELILRILDSGFFALVDSAALVEARGLELYATTELSPVLRWASGSRRIRIVPTSSYR